MGSTTTKRAVLVLTAMLVSACGSDSTSPQSVGGIVGDYTLTAVNGQKLPAPVTLPVSGGATVTDGSASIDAYSGVNISVSVTYGASQTKGTISETGVVTGGGGNYNLTFGDLTTATAKCTSTQCTVTYAPNIYVFTRG